MKIKYIYMVFLVLLFGMNSCFEKIDVSIESCSYNGASDNAANPYSALYQEILDEFVVAGYPGVSIAINTVEYGWWIGSAGMSKIEDETAMKPCHLLYSASMAKPATAALIMRLYEDQKLMLDDPIKKYLDEELVSNIANADKATIRQLLNHRSGIREWHDHAEAFVEIFNTGNLENSIDKHREDFLYGKPAVADTGEISYYSNTNYSLLAEIIDEVSGMSFEEYFNQEIRDVVGLQNTFCINDPAYGVNEINITVNDYYEPLEGELQNCTEIQKVLSNTGRGEAGIVSNPYEFARFLQELMRGNILDSGTIEMMKENVFEINEYYKLGYGFEHWYGPSEGRGPDKWGHTGATVGCRNVMLYMPEVDAILVVMSNLGGVLDSDNTRRFHPMVLDLLNVTFSGKRMSE